MDAGAVGQIPSRTPSIAASVSQQDGCVGRDTLSETHLMRATLRQVLNVPSTYHPYTGCSIGVEVCRQTTVAADKGT